MGDPTITFTSPPLGYSYQAGSPAYVRNVSHNIVGSLGNSIYYYWVVANYPSGSAPPPTPITVRNAPDILSPTNSILLNWVVPNGQVTSYSVLRTTTAIFPGTSNTAVVVNTTANTVTDTGSALVAFTLTPIPINRGVIYIDGTGPTPVLVSTLGIKTSSITFSDGSVQTSALTAAQIYNWTQNVQANGHQLLGLGELEVLGGTFGFNFTTTASAGTFPAGTLLIQNETTLLFPIAVNQNGDLWIGGPPVGGGRQARLSIVTPSGYPTPSNPSIYCYNPVGAAGVSITMEAAGQNATFTWLTTNVNMSFVATNGSGGFFYLNDNKASPGFRIIVQAGKIGIANGTFFTPAHQLELNADDAAKPTTNTWTISSDIRTKRNVKPLEGGIAIIERLQPIEGEYNGLAHTPDGHKVISFDPDELAKILPRSVSRIRRKLHPDDKEESDINCVNTHEIMHHLVLAVQQLSRQIKHAKGKVN